MKARDTDDPERVAELRWGAAIAAWERRDTAPLLELIAALPVPDFAADFLRDLAAETVNRPPGAPEARSPAHERRIAFAVFEAWDRFATGPRSSEGTPKARAIADVAGRFAMTEGQVRHVLATVMAGEAAQVEGAFDTEPFDLAAWRRYIKPRPKS